MKDAIGFAAGIGGFLLSLACAEAVLETEWLESVIKLIVFALSIGLAVACIAAPTVLLIRASGS